MAEKFPTPQERAMAWLLEATEIGGMSRPDTALYAYQAGSRRRSTCASKSKHDSTRRKPMTMLLDGRLRDLATQTHLLETKVSSLDWMAGAGAQTLKSMTRAQAHLMLAECDLLDALEANEKKEKNNEQ